MPYRSIVYHCSVCDVAFADLKGAQRCEERHHNG